MTPSPISQAAYARDRGIHKETVSKAIARVRLRDSVMEVDGVAQIVGVNCPAESGACARGRNLFRHEPSAAAAFPIWPRAWRCARLAAA